MVDGIVQRAEALEIVGSSAPCAGRPREKALRDVVRVADVVDAGDAGAEHLAVVAMPPTEMPPNLTP